MSLIAIATALALTSQPDCEAATDALDAVQVQLENDAPRQAQRRAEDAIEAAPDCVLSHLAMLRVLQERLEDANGLSALGLSRRYRRAVADTLEIDRDNVEARIAEIRYLIYAPGVAGGDRDQAAERIQSLSGIDALAGARMGLDLARANGEDEALITALEALIPLREDAADLRSELAYRLITTQQYDRAEAGLVSWPEGDVQVEADRAYFRGALRILGGFDLEAAEPLLTQALEAERDEAAAGGQTRAASIWGLIGGAREALEDLDGARQAYDRALAINPDNSRALEGLERLNAP